MRTPAEFIAVWRDNPLSERAGAQPFFLDLCEVLGVAKPGDPENYCFERGATRTGAGRGWADVWKRGCFAWENKAPGGHLGEALKQFRRGWIRRIGNWMRPWRRRMVGTTTSRPCRTLKSCGGCSP